MIAFLEHRASRQDSSEALDFVLMDHIDGVEVGVGAYFDGKTFLRPA